MASLGEFLGERAVMMLMTLLSNLSTNQVILKETIFLSRCRVSGARLMLGNLVISLVQMLPPFVAYYLWYYPGPIDMLVYSALVFPNPLMLFLYYWVYRCVFLLSREIGMMFIEWVLLAQYMAHLVFQVMSSLWAWLQRAPSGADWPTTDVIAIVCTSAVAWGTWIVLRLVVRRTGQFLELPSSYPLPKLVKTMPNMFMSCVINYMMLVFCSMFLVSRRGDGAMHSIWVFLLMILIQGYRVIDQYHTKRMRVLEWRAKATELYTDSLMRAMDEFRSLRHDFNNILQVYGGYISSRNLEGLASYHGGVTKTITRLNADMALIEALRARAPVYNLLSIKLRLAHELGIRFELEGANVLCDVPVNDLDLCRMLDILLDNAIEAAGESEIKRMRLSCRFEPSFSVAIVLTNTSADAGNAARALEEGFSTKLGHAGRGLNVVQDILISRNLGNMRVEAHPGWFTARLMLWSAS